MAPICPGTALPDKAVQDCTPRTQPPQSIARRVAALFGNNFDKHQTTRSPAVYRCTYAVNTAAPLANVAEMNMSYKTILAHIDGGEAGKQTLQIADQLAARFGAHLVAIYGTEWPMFAAAAMDPAAGELLRYQIEAEEESRAAAKAQIAAMETLTGRPIEWREIKADLTYSLAVHARHADLLVMGQDNPAHRVGVGPLLSTVAMRAGRPVLAVPFAGKFPVCGTSVLLAWNGSRESARAASDALPLLVAAKLVKVVAFNPGGAGRWGEIPGADFALWLARHGVSVEVDTRTSTEIDVGNHLLSMAADSGTDLIVMGAYGHSRTAEFILGGVTHTLLQSMTVPVLLSH